tara:strand:- start:160 stop:432 length:273 start_codon:yes stop_codon:yes gene_type:complete
MKVNIWIHKRDVVNNKITDYSYTRPYHDRNEEWVQVSISQDEFTQLEDKPTDIDYRSDSWKVDQYNRNRSLEDRIESIDELDQDNQPFAD